MANINWDKIVDSDLSGARTKPHRFKCFGHFMIAIGERLMLLVPLVAVLLDSWNGGPIWTIGFAMTAEHFAFGLPLALLIVAPYRKYTGVFYIIAAILIVYPPFPLDGADFTKICCGTDDVLLEDFPVQLKDWSRIPVFILSGVLSFHLVELFLWNIVQRNVPNYS